MLGFCLVYEYVILILKNSPSASWLVRKLTSVRLDWPWLDCPVSEKIVQPHQFTFNTQHNNIKNGVTTEIVTSLTCYATVTIWPFGALSVFWAWPFPVATSFVGQSSAPFDVRSWQLLTTDTLARTTARGGASRTRPRQRSVSVRPTYIIII